MNFRKIMNFASFRASSKEISSLGNLLEQTPFSTRLGFPMVRVAALACATLVCTAAADEEITNYKSGISLLWGGTRGTDYAEEYFYFDKLIHDAKVVYIKAGTPITMEHNERNIGVPAGKNAYETVGLDFGAIKFKPDGDQYRLPYPQDWTPYTAPFTFASLNYGLFGASATPVVGTTGATGGDLTDANRTSRYFRGMLDTVGDEWHTLTVADDDVPEGVGGEWRASDGKVWLFVVNPKTPCLTLRVTGSGQFYTTPPKKYFFPIIYDQTTYLDAGASGSVTLEITDINGNNVFYRIVSDPADAVTAYTDAGGKTVTLDDTDFATGEQYLQYYYAGNAAYKKTRKVVKNPAYPSAGETHGDRLWINASLFESEVRPRIDGNPDLKRWKDFFRTNSTWNGSSSINTTARTGKRFIVERAWPHAITARLEGMTFRNGSATYTASEYAKLCLFEGRYLVDPVGYEADQWSGNPLPCRDVCYRGYYDVPGVYGAAMAYDVLIGYFRTNQGHPTGISAVEDFFIRDALARWVHMSQMILADYTRGGMWPNAHVTGSMLIAGVMPSYSTPYFGTCGLDGNTTTYDWTPCPAGSTNYTWKELFFTENVPLTGYPNIARYSNVNEHFNPETFEWQDRIGYSQLTMFGNCITMAYNTLKLFNPEASYPNVDAAMKLAAQGLLKGSKFSDGSPGDPYANPPIEPTGDYAPALRVWCQLQNTWFEDFRSVAQPAMKARAWPDQQSLGRQMQDGREAFALIWFDHNLPFPGEANRVPLPSGPEGLRIQE